MMKHRQTLTPYPVLVGGVQVGIIHGRSPVEARAFARGLLEEGNRPKLPPGEDEWWRTRAGRTVRVEDMHEGHVRNALRMVIRQTRERKAELLASIKYRALAGMTEGDAQNLLHGEAMRALGNPNCYFPLLDGGVYGSPELAKRHRR